MYSEEYRENCRMSLENRLTEEDVHCPACGSEAMGCGSAKSDGHQGIVYCCSCWARFCYSQGTLIPIKHKVKE